MIARWEGTKGSEREQVVYNKGNYHRAMKLLNFKIGKRSGKITYAMGTDELYEKLDTTNRGIVC